MSSRPRTPAALSSTPSPEPASLPRPLPGSAGRLALGLVEALPLLLPALFAGFSLVAMVLLHLGLYRPALVLPLGLIGAAAAGLGVGLVRPEPLAGNRLLDGAAVLVTLGFAALNVRYSAQNISVFRDPAAYAVTGQWLVHHGSLPIPVEAEVFGAVPGVSFYSAAFDPGPAAGFIYPQYGNLLPGLLAVAGWLYSDGLLKLNAMIGSAALLGFYGLVRQYTARVWALVAAIVLGVSLPQLHFSRNSYSEPVTMLFLVGGLALLREAQRRGSTRGYGLAGLVLGSAALARIDGLYFLLTVPLLAAATLAIASPERRRDATRKVTALLLGVAVPLVVAMVNLADLSSPLYLDNLGSELAMIAAAAVAITVVGAVAVVLAWRTRLLHRLAAATGRWLPGVGAAAVMVLAAVAASRPLWYVGRIPDAPEPQIHYITFLQKANGLPLDGTRSYAEQTMLWFSWYYGPVTVALGVLGVAFGVHRLLRRGDLRLLAPLAMFLSAALLYITVPSIVPDQIWAMRRYLPVVIPGLLLAAAAVLGLLARRSRTGMAAAALLAGIMILIPAMLSSRLVTVRDLVPQLPEVLNLCDNLPADAALLTTGSLAVTYPQTARSYCQVPVAAVRQPTRAQLKQIQATAQAHDRRLYLLFTDPDEVPRGSASAGAAWQQISCVLISHWNATLNKAVADHGFDKRMLYLGEITPEGMVTPAPSSRPPLWAC